MSEQRPSNQVVDALTRALNFKRSRAEFLRSEALNRFKANDPVVAYRCLGAAEEIDLFVNEFDQLRVKIALGDYE